MIAFTIKLEDPSVRFSSASIQFSGMADGLPDLLSQIQESHNVLLASVKNVNTMQMESDDLDA